MGVRGRDGVRGESAQPGCAGAGSLEISILRSTCVSAGAPWDQGRLEGDFPILGQVLLEGAPGPPTMEREEKPFGGDPQDARLRGMPDTCGTGEAAESSRRDLAALALQGLHSPPPHPSRPWDRRG